MICLVIPILSLLLFIQSLYSLLNCKFFHLLVLHCVCYACRASVAACNVCVHVLVGVNVSGIMCSAHSCGCVADGRDAMAAL